MSGQGYSLHLWYDSDALLAWQTNQLIVEAAKADAMQHGGSESITDSRLGTLYEERVIVLKQQMFMHINEALERGNRRMTHGSICCPALTAMMRNNLKP